MQERRDDPKTDGVEDRSSKGCCVEHWDEPHEKFKCQKASRIEKRMKFVTAIEWWAPFGYKLVPLSSQTKWELVDVTVADVRSEYDWGAVFKDSDECACKCCQFRLLVRGTALVDGKPPADHLLADGKKLSPTEFQEDGPRRYGHRDDDNRDNDKYAPKRADGCEYTGYDISGVYGMDPGSTFDINFEFEARIIDVCNKDKIVKSKTWTVHCQGVA